MLKTTRECQPARGTAWNGVSVRVWPGNPYPLGATWDGAGVNFSLFSEHATAVELCLFDSVEASAESERVQLVELDGGIWHSYLPDARPGQLYGYRVHGPYEPESGQRFNASKVLLDPYAKAVARTTTWNDRMFGYRVGAPEEDLSYSDADSAAFAPLGTVVDPAFTWGEDQPPGTAWEHTVIYELHVKGFTQLHPEVPPPLRGTYAGLSTEPVIEHLKTLGVTAVELMPVHQHVEDRHLVERGLTNYWGYNTLAFFAPESRYATTGQGVDAVREFKVMVRNLHAAGIEVFLDVVYNHTAEGSHLGPTLSLRGIDNLSYYRTVPDTPRYYMDFTGTGNTLNLQHPRVLQLVMDSLRYWVLEMHVDGFRFDLASALARELYEVDRLGSFFDIIGQDPVLADVKLIAEPWDLGEGGYQVGNFPVGWTEWNGKYRDTVRRYWRGDDGQLSEFATRLTGSSDLYEASGRRPFASINFVTAHDGFTLHDLVSYNHKHNEANGEGNRDGTDDNISWNGGVEGETANPAVLALRNQQMRNFLATMLVSQGVPMLVAGDEFARTQRGNNNAYCQDNELSWIDWRLTREQRDLLRFTRALIQLRQEQPTLHRRRFLLGRRTAGSDVHDIAWFLPEGRQFADEDWHDPLRHCFGLRLAGDAIGETGRRGERITGDTLMILFNSGDADQEFQLPIGRRRQRWHRLIDTATSGRRDGSWVDRDRYRVHPRSLVVLRSGSRKV